MSKISSGEYYIIYKIKSKYYFPLRIGTSPGLRLDLSFRKSKGEVKTERHPFTLYKGKGKGDEVFKR